MSAPEGWIPPSLGSGSQPGILLATPSKAAIAGAIGTQKAEIRVHRKYNAKKSDLVNSEVYDDYEVAEFTNDKFSTSTLRISNLSEPKNKCYNELTVPQRMQLGELQERFRTQKDSRDTIISKWEAINVADKQALAQMGIMFVEQIANYRDDELYKLGNSGLELREKARRHVASKNPNRQETFDKDMAVLLEQREQDRKEMEAMKAQLLELQASRATAAAKKPSTRKRIKAGVQAESAEA